MGSPYLRDTGLPPDVRDTELRFHQSSALPEKIAFQLKLLPKQDYLQTISKARELLLIYQRAADSVYQVRTNSGDDRLDRLEEAVQQMSQQVAALGTRRPDSAGAYGCFRRGKPGHLTKIVDPRQHERSSAFAVERRDTSHANASFRETAEGRPDSSSRGRPPPQLNGRAPENVPALIDHTRTSKAAYTQGLLNYHKVEMLLDSGASCSVIRQDYTEKDLVSTAHQIECALLVPNTDTFIGVLCTLIMHGVRDTLQRSVHGTLK